MPRRPRRKRQRKRSSIIVVLLLVCLVVIVSLSYFLTRPQVPAPPSPSQPVQPFVITPENSEYTTEYPTQTNGTEPNAIAVDAHGNVWFALWNLSSIAELIPANNTIHEYRVPGLQEGSMITWSIDVDSSRGIVWFPELTSNSIWAFNMSSDKFIQYKLPTANAFPFGLTIDSNHDVWFTEFYGNKIGELTTQGSIIEIPIPENGELEASGITTDPSGRVWFTLPGVDSIGYYYQNNFTIQNLTGLINTPVGIVIDLQGNIWITQHGPSFISELNFTNHYIKTISTSNNSFASSLPYFIHVDSNGNIWFNEHQGNAMSEFIPASNTLIEYFIPTEIEGGGNISDSLTSALSQSGQPWYTELLSGKVGTVNTSKALSLNLNVLNYSQSDANIADGNEISLGLSITSQSGAVTLHGYTGNFTTQGNFTFSFSPEADNVDTFRSVVTIENSGATAGVYFVTITARTTSLAVSKIIEITVP